MRRSFAVTLAMVLMAAGRCFAWTPAMEDPFFHSTDPLAPQDNWGKLRQSKTLYPPDFEPRYHWRPLYYFEGKHSLMQQPAYVGALQRDLQRLGYYCGPIDGVWSDAIVEAICKLQKNHSMRVTGTLTIPVRRALHLP